MLRVIAIFDSISRSILLYCKLDKQPTSCVLSCIVSCVPQKKSTSLLLASITAERWFSEDVCILKIARKHRVFKVYTPANSFRKNRTTSYKFETNNQRSGPKGRRFKSCHLDQKNDRFRVRSGRFLLCFAQMRTCCPGRF